MKPARCPRCYVAQFCTVCQWCKVPMGVWS